MLSFIPPDGRSHDNVVTPSNTLKATGVIVYAVGIGRADVNELRVISSDPDDEHVFLLNSFRDAAGFVDFLSVTTCESMYICSHKQLKILWADHDISQVYWKLALTMKVLSAHA